MDVLVKGLSCGCLTLRLLRDDKEIRKGEIFAIGVDESVQIGMEMVVPRKAGIHLQTATFELYQNVELGLQKVAKFTGKIRVLEDVISIPPVISCRHGTIDGKAVSRTIKIVQTSRSESELTEQPVFIGIPEVVECDKVSRLSLPRITPSFLSTEWNVSIRIQPPNASAFADKVFIDFPASPHLRLEIPVVMEKKDGLEISPSSIVFNPSLNSSQQKLLIKSLDSEPFEVKEIQTDCELVSAIAIGGGLRTSHWIDVQMDLGKVLSSDITASIYIYTNHPIIQRIEIPVLLRSKCLQANE